MVGLGMDFDEFPFTPIEKTLVPEAPDVKREKTADVRSSMKLMRKPTNSSWRVYER
jgi:hypothetical protein